MSVDRLAGSGTAGKDTEPARRRRAQRRGTERRRGGDASAVELAEPGQAGPATAAPESNVILLGQEASPGPSAATPERSAAAPVGREQAAAVPAGQEQAEATAHAAEAARAGAPPTDEAGAAAAAGAAAGAKGTAVPDPAATEAGTTEADTTEAGTTKADTTEAGTTKADTTQAGTTEADTTRAGTKETDATQAAAAPDRAPRPAPAETGLFARYTRDYVTGHDGHQITILQAGCTTADGDLGVGVLREAGADVAVSLIDDDQPVTRAALAADGSLAGCVQGDLRTVPLPPRSHDIVLCSLLLQRIDHAELVLDRLVAAIRPGGLLLLRFSDRDSSGGFLDRVMPLAARNAVWRKRRPGRPGPYPAVYERLSSVRGVQAYALMRELVIAERQALGGLAGALPEPRGFLATQKLVAWFSRGRLTAAHEELLYVLRKPEDRFARVL
jgi:SAM-dependent methyltransferase